MISLLIIALLITIYGHFLTEYTLQRTKLGLCKRNHFTGLLVHALLWTMSMCPGLYLVGVLTHWKVLFLFFTHTGIDFIKMKLVTKKIKATHPINITDQLLHFLTVIIAYIK